MSGRIEYCDSGISYLGTEESGGKVEMGLEVRDVTLKIWNCQMRSFGGEETVRIQRSKGRKGLMA